MPSETKKVRVLVVEDEPIMRAIFEHTLGILECELVGVAEDGPAGLQMFEDTVPDIVLLDILMPGMGGVEVLAEIRKRDPEAYVVMLTSVDDEAVIEDCMIAGARDYVRKDLPADQVVTRLRRHFDRFKTP